MASNIGGDQHVDSGHLIIDERNSPDDVDNEDVNALLEASFENELEEPQKDLEEREMIINIYNMVGRDKDGNIEAPRQVVVKGMPDDKISKHGALYKMLLSSFRIFQWIVVDILLLAIFPFTAYDIIKTNMYMKKLKRILSDPEFENINQQIRASLQGNKYLDQPGDFVQLMQKIRVQLQLMDTEEDSSRHYINVLTVKYMMNKGKNINFWEKKDKESPLYRLSSEEFRELPSAAGHHIIQAEAAALLRLSRTILDLKKFRLYRIIPLLRTPYRIKRYFKDMAHGKFPSFGKLDDEDVIKKQRFNIEKYLASIHATHLLESIINDDPS